MKDQKKMTKAEKLVRIKELSNSIDALKNHLNEFNNNVELTDKNERLEVRFTMRICWKETGDTWNSTAMKLFNLESLNPQVILTAYKMECEKNLSKWERELNSLIS